MKTVTTETRLLVAGSGHGAGFKIGFVPAGESARKETGGPLVPGPWAYAFGLSHVIDNHGGTGGEIEREERKGLVVRVELGEQIEIDGRGYAIVPAANNNIDLIPSAAVFALPALLAACEAMLRMPYPAIGQKMSMQSNSDIQRYREIVAAALAKAKGGAA